MFLFYFPWTAHPTCNINPPWDRDFIKWQLFVIKGPEFQQKIFKTGHILNSTSASYVSWLVLSSQLPNSPLSSSYGTCFILTSKNYATDHNCLHGRVVGRSLSVSNIFVSQSVFRICVTHTKYCLLSQPSYAKPWFLMEEAMKGNSKGIWICGHLVSVIRF
jgi:hypothetical protein